jgi:ubiquitin carboxyl-terminal hydrolase 48
MTDLCSSKLDHIVACDELASWIRADSYDLLHRPFSTSAITCNHGGVDPSKTNEVRSISHEAFDKLQQYSSIPDLQICPICVDEGFARRLAASQLTDAVGAFDRLNHGGGYAMPRKWVAEWRKGTLPSGALPTDDDYTLFCEHEKANDGKRVSVSPAAVLLLQSVLGDFAVFEENEPMCEACRAGAAVDQEARWAVMQKRLKQQLDVKPAPFGVNHYVLPMRFHEAWLEWLRNSGCKPELEMDLCEHGLIDFDPMIERVHYLTEGGWKMLCAR